MTVNMGRRRGDRGLLGRALLIVCVLIAAALMAWRVSSAVDSNHTATLNALKQSEQRDARLAARADAAAAQAKAAAVQAVRAQQLAAAIQLSRKRDCLAQNYRHHNAVNTFQRVLRQAARHSTPAERRQAKANRRRTLQLLNAIVPSRDCANP